MIREAVAESWLEGAQFGPYIQKNFIDQKLFPVNEAGRYQCTFRLVALGEDEFNAYAAANGLAAEAFKDTQNFRGSSSIKISCRKEALMPSMSRCT